VIKAANHYLSEKPVTITASHSARSSGGLHDYFSEGDYWWPDPNNPTGPYVQRDGMSNPDNFNDHRRALMRLSVQVPALAAAWSITKDKRYANGQRQSARLVYERANQVNRTCSMLRRSMTACSGTGSIDTIHLVEVARAPSRC
jgi:hypothetical protein